MYEFSEYVHIKCGLKKLLMPEEEILNVELPKVRKYKDKYLINFYWMRSTMSYYGDIIYDCYLLGLESIFVYIRNE